MPGIYDDDVFIEGDGEFESNIKERKKDALEDYNEGDELCLTFIPIKEWAYKQQDGWASYICENNDDCDAPPTFVLCGHFTEPLDIGHTYRSDGKVSYGKTNRLQFHIINITKVVPETRHGIVSFLRSLDGMKFQSEVIYEQFATESLQIIVNEPQKILELLPNSYLEQVEVWQKQIRECKNNYGRLTELINKGMKPAQAKKAYAKFGDEIFTKIDKDPFFLIGKIRGYGFKRGDEIGRKSGIEPNDLERLCAGILYVLQTMTNNGSTCVSKEKLIVAAMDELSVKMTYYEMAAAAKVKNDLYPYSYGKTTYKIPVAKIKNDLELYNAASAWNKASCRTVVFPIVREDIEKALNTLRLSERVVIEDDLVYVKKYYDEEFNIAYYIQQINRHKISIGKDMAETLVDDYCEQNNISLEEKQREAVISICSNMGGVNIVNGAAGCGKTFCIKIALKVLESIYVNAGKQFDKIIVAPTGKAARVAYKQTGIDSFTIHRALQQRPNEGFFYNAKNKLPYDCIVIDETSMLDTDIAYALISAIDSESNVIILGDTNQLPSISSGNVLHDLIASGIVDVTTLNVIRRQGKDSGIVLNARNIINGEMIVSRKEFDDAYVVAANTDKEYVDKIFRYCDQYAEQGELDSVQLLSPMKRGITGTHYLNYVMQQRYNPGTNGIEIPKTTFEVTVDGSTQKIDLSFKYGDKVINTRNDYSLPWYHLEGSTLVKDEDKVGVTNGEVGTIVLIKSDVDEYGDTNYKICVQYEDKFIVYKNDFDSLELAYAITIHRSQGSEWPVVIMALHRSHKSMIDRNLFYTGVTRAKKKHIVISDRDTIMYGVRNTKSMQRSTGLVSRLHEMIQTPRMIVDDMGLDEAEGVN